MKIRHLERRLAKQESALRCEPDEYADYSNALVWFALAYYLGNPSRGEKPFAAFARALGYASESALNSALDNEGELLMRFVPALAKLYKKFGYDRDSDPTGLEVHKRMAAGLPTSYRNHIARVLSAAKVSLKWMYIKSLGAYIRCFA
jgi:hypothetical protein